jgi:hypothetical protein
MRLIALVPLLALSAPPETGQVVLHDGKEIRGQWLGLRDGAILLEGAGEPIPIYEVSALHPRVPSGGSATNEEKPRSLDEGPALFFRDGEAFAGRVTAATGTAASVEIQAPGTRGSAPAVEAPGQLAIRIPMEALQAFRLRETHKADDLFEADLKDAGRRAASRKADVVYVRRGANLLRVEGVFQSLDNEHLTLEFEGQAKRIRRQLVLGVILAPVASRSVESEVPAVFELQGGGQIPGYLAGLRGEGSGREVLMRFRGSAPTDAQPIPEGILRSIRFSSDRVIFLSSLEPARVEEVPLLGATNPFPWRKDQAVTGGPLKLGGKTYRKGLGVHPRSILEFDLEGRYRSFAATIGLDDGAGPEAALVFRVLADGKELLRKDMGRGTQPEVVLLPMDGVKRLRLEVDYGEDGVDFGDHADWADARVTK